jgi:transcriptional antiterminator
MPKKLYAVCFSKQERSTLEKIVNSGKSTAKEVLRANILLNSDTFDGRIPVKTRELATLLNTSPTTVQNVRKEYSESGVEETIRRKKRESPPVQPKADGEFEARLIALACQQPPEGYAKWNLKMLADKSVELGYIDSVSRMTISRTLKKTNSSLI